MVENTPSSSSYVKLRIKGLNGQSIDLRKLEGLKKTKDNAAIFNFIKDNDGVISKEEAKKLASALQQAAGNGKISQREINKMLGTKNSDGIQLLNKLAEQQNSKDVYKEGNTTVDKKNNTVVTTDEKGVTTTRKYNGNSLEIITQSKDGTRMTFASEKDFKEGKFSEAVTGEGSNLINKWDSNGVHTRTQIEDGKKTVWSSTGEVTVTESNGANESVTKFASEKDYGNGKILQKINNPNAQNPQMREVINYNYDNDGNITSITKTKGQTTTTYASQEDFDSGKATTIVKNTGIDAKDSRTDFTTQNGIRTGVTKGALGRASGITLENDKGQPIDTMSVDVKKGDKFDDVIDKMMDKYGLPKQDDFVRNRVKAALVKENYKSDGTGLCRRVGNDGYYYFLAGKTANLSLDGLNEILDNNESNAALVAKSPFVQNMTAANYENVDFKPNINLDPVKNQTIKHSLAKQSKADLINLWQSNTINDPETLHQMAIQLAEGGNREQRGIAAQIETRAQQLEQNGTGFKGYKNTGMNSV